MAIKHALVVDDSKSARYLLGKMLGKFSMTFDTADSAEEALAYLDVNNADIIFMDHTMPGMNGLQAISVIKDNPDISNIPIVMYTSRKGESYAKQAMAYGVSDVLLKPTNVKALGNVIKKLDDAQVGSNGADTPQLAGAVKSVAGLTSETPTQEPSAQAQEPSAQVQKPSAQAASKSKSTIAAELKPKSTPTLQNGSHAAAKKASTAQHSEKTRKPNDKNMDDAVVLDDKIELNTLEPIDAQDQPQLTPTNSKQSNQKPAENSASDHNQLAELTHLKQTMNVQLQKQSQLESQLAGLKQQFSQRQQHASPDQDWQSKLNRTETQLQKLMQSIQAISAIKQQQAELQTSFDDLRDVQQQLTRQANAGRDQASAIDQDALQQQLQKELQQTIQRQLKPIIEEVHRLKQQSTDQHTSDFESKIAQSQIALREEYQSLAGDISAKIQAELETKLSASLDELKHQSGVNSAEQPFDAEIQKFIAESTEEMSQHILVESLRKAEHTATDIALQITEDWVDNIRVTMRRNVITTILVASLFGCVMGVVGTFLLGMVG